jgi:hypothetical protein
LHNFCINERILESDEHVDPVVEANGMGRGVFEEALVQLAKYEAVLEDLPGFSGNREQMAMRIEGLGLQQTTTLC